MATRLQQPLGRLICALILSAFVEHCALAQHTVDYGTVTDLEIYRASNDQPINTGTVVGGIAGGVIGHQIGSGRGNTAATIIGTIGGAAIGNQIEKNSVQRPRYRITIKLDSGSSLIIEETRDMNLRVGDRVRLEDDRIYRQ